MKFIKNILTKGFILSSVILPSAIVLSCNTVDGEIKYEIKGINANKTDFIIDVKVDNQYIARIIEKNLKDREKIANQLKNKILNDIKNVFPKAYKEGIFKNESPSIVLVNQNNYKIFFPINENITDLPKLNNILENFRKKYNYKKDVEKLKKDVEDEMFFGIDLSNKNNREKEINKKYNVVENKQKEVQDNDIVDFNYLGISSYMNGKLTNEILKNIFSNLKNKENNKYQNVEEFLNENFDGKLNMDQIQKNVTLKGNFEIKQWQNENAKVFFYISKIKEKNPLYKPNSSNEKNKNEYVLKKDTKKPFSIKNKNKAEIHYSLFLEKNIKPKNTQTIEVDVDDKKLIGESKTENIFVGLKQGTGHSRPILINKEKFPIEFDDTNKKINNDVLKYFIESHLGTIEEKQEKDIDGNTLYQIKYNKKLKVIFSFDIKEIWKKDENNNWVIRPENETAKKGDKVIYENAQINYIGYPFKGGESSGNHIMYIDVEGDKSGFIKGFDKLIVKNKLKINSPNFITPIFPDDFNKKNLASKLVKFKIKINRIMNRKELNNQFFIENEVKNSSNNKKIHNNNEFWKYINEKFKQNLLIDLIINYISKAKAQIPYVKVEKKIQEAYRALYLKNLRNKKNEKPKIEDVKKRAKELATLDAKFNQFLKNNNFWSNQKVKRNRKIVNYLVAKISQKNK